MEFQKSQYLDFGVSQPSAEVAEIDSPHQIKEFHRAQAIPQLSAFR